MTLLHAQGVAFRHAGASDFLFRDLTLALAPGDRLALVGSNGCGKSSLLALLAGQLAPSEGLLWRRPGLHLASLPQAPTPPGPSLLAEAMSAHRRVGPLRQALDAAERVAEAQGWDEASALAHAEALDAYGAADAWALEAEAAQVLAGLGLPVGRHGEPVAQLSGGERQRLALARLLLAHSELLLLDEPTNHLDAPARRWLKGHLAKAPEALAFASHDRGFLGTLAGRVLRLSRGEHHLDAGGWASHLARQAEREGQAWAAYEGQRRRFAAAEAQYAERLGLADRVAEVPKGPGLGAKDFYWAKAARVARTAKILRERPLREAPAEKPRFEESPTALRFPSAAFQAEWPLVAEDLGLRQGDRLLFEGLDLALHRGQKLGLVGPNGAGKSTLLAWLAGRLTPPLGRVRQAPRVRVAWVDQDAGRLDEGLSPAALAAAAHPDRAWGRTVLGALRLRGRLAEQPLGELSQGQRLLVAIALAMLGEAQVLLLDEPNNHLDLAASEALEQSLASYPGACLVASHDPAFLGAFAEGLLHLDGQGGWRLQDLDGLT